MKIRRCKREISMTANASLRRASNSSRKFRHRVMGRRILRAGTFPRRCRTPSGRASTPSSVKTRTRRITPNKHRKFRSRRRRRRHQRHSRSYNLEAAPAIRTSRTRIKTGAGIEPCCRFRNAAMQIPRGVFAFARAPPLAKCPCGNLPPAIRGNESARWRPVAANRRAVAGAGPVFAAHNAADNPRR